MKINSYRLYLLLLLLTAVHALPAQSIRDSLLVGIKEREYKLIQLPNGDLLPFVAQGSVNIDKYLENGRLIKEVYLNLYGKPSGYRLHHYYGDTLYTTHEYDKSDKLKERDSVIYFDKKLKEAYHASYGYNNTVEEHYTMCETCKVIQQTTYYENGQVTRKRFMERPDSNTIYNYQEVKDGVTSYRDTLRFYYYPDKHSKLTAFFYEGRASYTIQEYATDHRGNIITGMTFYNQDSVGDHIESFVRRIEYKNEKPPVIDRKFFIGYWVMMQGMKYWQFLENGKVRMRRAGKDQQTVRNWGWDAQRRQVYIELTAEDKEDISEVKLTGNRLYLEYKPAEQLLVYGDNEYQKRPVIKRPARDEKKVKEMIRMVNERK